MINTKCIKATSKKLQMYDPAILELNNDKNQQKLVDWLSREIKYYSNYSDFDASLTIDFHNNIFIHYALDFSKIPANNIAINPKVIPRNRRSVKNWAKAILSSAEQFLQDRYNTEQDASQEELSDILYEHNLNNWSPMFSAKAYVDYIVTNLDDSTCNMINMPYLSKEPIYLAEQLLTNFHAEMFKNNGVLSVIISCFKDINDNIDPTISTLMHKIIEELNNPNSVIGTTAYSSVDYQRIVELCNTHDTITMPMRTLFKFKLDKPSNVQFCFVNDFDYLTTLNLLNKDLNEMTNLSLITRFFNKSNIGKYRRNIEQEIKIISSLKNQTFFQQLTNVLQLLLDNAK